MKYRIVKLDIPNASINTMFNIQRRRWFKKWATIHTSYTESEARKFLHTYLWDHHSYAYLPGQVIEEIEIK